MQTENAIQSHSHGLKLFKSYLKLFKNSESATLNAAEFISECMAFLYCSVSEHLSQDFQDGLAFLFLLL